MAFPKIDLTTKLSDIASNVSYYDISYYDNSVKTQKGIEKCKAEYIVIYNAMKADINNTDKQLAKNEKINTCKCIDKSANIAGQRDITNLKPLP